MWTGYTWEELVTDMDKRDGDIVFDILVLTDVLVDGPYIESKRNISLPYMGSSNQRVIDCSATRETYNLKKPVLLWTPE